MNTFTTFLKLLKVRHTDFFSNKYYNEHPYKYNLFGLSSMLSNYGIENAGLKIDDKQTNFPKLKTPFIALISNDFVVVVKRTHEKVEFKWKNNNISVSIDNFLNIWSGIVLLAEPTESSCEPHYKAHRINELQRL